MGRERVSKSVCVHMHAVVCTLCSIAFDWVASPHRLRLLCIAIIGTCFYGSIMAHANSL
jgi:hypothetical protein